MDWTFWVGNAITAAIAVIGWVITAISGRNAGKEQSERFETEMEAQRKRLERLDDQVAVLQSQAKSLEEQTDMQRAKFTKAPFSDAEWVRGSLRRVRVEGARRVHVESVTAELGGVFRLCTPIPDSFEPGETIEYLTNGPLRVEFAWRWDDEPDMPLRTIRKVSYKP